MYFYSLWMGCESIAGLPPSIKFLWVERGSVRVTCLAQEHNTMSPDRTARNRSARSGVERTNHEANGLRAYSQLG